MATYHPAGSGVYTLSSSISSTATSITLSSFAEPVSGTVYTMANLNTDIAYGTIAPKTDNAEFISFTGITENADGTVTLTGVTRGLAKKYPFTASATFRLPHPGQSQFILSDAPQVFEKYVTLENNETITGTKTFPAGGNANAPVSGTVYSAPTNDLEYASKKYVDDIAIAGAPDATTSVKGIVEIATQAEMDAGTATGGTGASIIPTPAIIRAKAYHDYAADSVGTDAYAITITPAITAYAAGQIFTFKAGTANTGAATLNVSGLGAKTIKKSQNLDLETGDIKANQIVVVCYDGTNMQLLSEEALKSVAMGGTGATSFTDGGVLIGNSTGAIQVTSAGTAGQVLTSNGAGVDPTFQTAFSNKILVDRTDVTVTGTTSETTLYTVSVAGGTLGTNNAIEGRINLSSIGGPNADRTWTIRLKYGGSTIATAPLGPVSLFSSTNSSGWIDFRVIAAGATNSQEGYVNCTGFVTAFNQTNNGPFADGVGTSAVDSTANQTLLVSVQMNNTDMTISATSCVIRKIA